MHELLKFDVIWNKYVPSCDNLSIMKKKIASICNVLACAVIMFWKLISKHDTALEEWRLIFDPHLMIMPWMATPFQLGVHYVNPAT